MCHVTEWIRSSICHSVLLHGLGHTGMRYGSDTLSMLHKVTDASIFAKSMYVQNRIDGSDTCSKNHSMSVT